MLASTTRKNEPPLSTSSCCYGNFLQKMTKPHFNIIENSQSNPIFALKLKKKTKKQQNISLNPTRIKLCKCHIFTVKASSCKVRLTTFPLLNCFSASDLKKIVDKIPGFKPAPSVFVVLFTLILTGKDDWKWLIHMIGKSTFFYVDFTTVNEFELFFKNFSC